MYSLSYSSLNFCPAMPDRLNAICWSWNKSRVNLGKINKSHISSVLFFTTSKLLYFRILVLSRIVFSSSSEAERNNKANIIRTVGLISIPNDWALLSISIVTAYFSFFFIVFFSYRIFTCLSIERDRF